MKVLVIGSGLVGQNLAGSFQTHLLPDELKVFSSRWLTSQDNLMLEDLISGSDVILWSARDAGLPSDGINSEKLWERIQNLLQRSQWAGKFVYLSSAGSIYGDGTDGPYSESSDTNPVDVYGALKLKHEDQLKNNAAKCGFEYLILRISNIFTLTPEDVGIVGAILRSMQTKEAFNLMWGLQTRDFIHLSDVCKATIELWKKDAVGIFNVASGSSISILNLVSKLEFKYHKQSFYTLQKEIPPIIRSEILIEKLITLTNWKPESIDEYLRKESR
jgi:nucleoside-diphosphate-sugar epimerase